MRLGSRKSPLALIQAGMAADAIRRTSPGLEVEIVPITSEGDRDRKTRLNGFSQRGVFTRALEDALSSGAIDAAVHSAKDVPSVLDPAFRLAGALPRADARDALVAPGGEGFMGLARGARVGTGSPRRAAQLGRLRRDIVFHPLRGNVQTRLDKLDRGDADALVLAAAGLERQGLGERITERISFDACLPAAGQGVIVMETLARSGWAEIVEKAGSRESGLCLEAERSFLKTLGAGCSAAVGAAAVLKKNGLELWGRVLDVAGKEMIEERTAVEIPGDGGDAQSAAAGAGERLAKNLIARGASDLLE